jgi:type III secretory pathway component EscU
MSPEALTFAVDRHEEQVGKTYHNTDSLSSIASNTDVAYTIAYSKEKLVPLVISKLRNEALHSLAGVRSTQCLDVVRRSLRAFTVSSEMQECVKATVSGSDEYWANSG